MYYFGGKGVIYNYFIFQIIALTLLVCTALARPQQRLALPRDAVILKYESENDGNGQYKYA